MLPWAVDLTGVAMTDVLPDGIAVAGTPSASTTCSGGVVTAAAAASSLALSVLGLPTVTKAFAPASIGANVVSTLALGNPNASPITLSSALVDALPGNVLVAAADSLPPPGPERSARSVRRLRQGGRREATAVLCRGKAGASGPWSVGR